MTPREKHITTGVQHLQSVDPTLALIISTAPIPSILPHTKYYQELVESIISQQLSVKAAATIQQRFLSLFGDTFPQPADILTKTIEELRAIGLSRQKASYIQDLALKVIEGAVSFDHLDSLTNDEIIAELTQIKGVGVWTVHMFLMFCMGRLDVLPVGDLGIQNAIQKAYDLANRPKPEEVSALAIAHGWHPYESLASWYLWHSLDNKPAV